MVIKYSVVYVEDESNEKHPHLKHFIRRNAYFPSWGKKGRVKIILPGKSKASPVASAISTSGIGFSDFRTDKRFHLETSGSA